LNYGNSDSFKGVAPLKNDVLTNDTPRHFFTINPKRFR